MPPLFWTSQRLSSVFSIHTRQLPEALRFYLLGLGVKTLLIIPLTLGGQANGQLSFRFTEERDFDPEELEIARALAIQASLAIHLTRLAKAARQSAVLEERNQLAAEIHDSLAQSFHRHLDATGSRRGATSGKGRRSSLPNSAGKRNRTSLA